MSDKAPKEKVEIEPSVKDKALFEWLEEQFDGTGQFPEKLEVRVVSGPNKERLGPIIDQVPFAPAAKAEVREKGEKVEKVVKGGKPGREELVVLANRFTSRCQRDCDIQRKSVTYAVFVHHFARDPDFYGRILMRMVPKGVHTNDGTAREGEDEDEEFAVPALRREKQSLDHDRQMFSLYGGAVEGIMDRLDRMIEREQSAHEATRARLEKQQEIVERLSSNSMEREAAMKWQDLKVKSAERLLDTAINFAPPLLNQLMGKSIIPTKETTDSLSLKEFFKTLNESQMELAFGKYDDSPEHKLLAAGVLTFDQAQLLYAVAQCAVPSDALDRLIPGGDLEVTMDKVMELQKIFRPEQIAPLMSLIGMRMQRRQQQNGQ